MLDTAGGNPALRFALPAEALCKPEYKTHLATPRGFPLCHKGSSFGEGWTRESTTVTAWLAVPDRCSGCETRLIDGVWRFHYLFFALLLDAEDDPRRRKRADRGRVATFALCGAKV